MLKRKINTLMKTLFISYNGALEPLTQSQGISYLKGLSGKGVKCFLLTFEKNFEGIADLKKDLGYYGIKWYYLRYHKSPSLLVTSFDILMGTLIGLYIVVSQNITIVHSRATVPAVMGCIIAKLTGKKFIFDLRGLMAEEYVDGGMWKRRGILYKLTRYIEKKLLSFADKIVVLSENIKDFLISSNYLRKGNIEKKNIVAIPCCVDVEKFSGENALTGILKEKYDLGRKFVFLYTGSFGSWYLLEEMMDFFVVAKGVIENAHFLVLTNADKDIAVNAWGKRRLPFSDITIDRVKFYDMPRYIKLADVGIFFIKPCFSKRASCPTKFAEYLSGGLPVIINDGIGDTGSIVKDNKIGVVLGDFNATEYQKAVMSIKKLLEKKDVLKKRCVYTAEKYFSLKEGIGRYYKIYSDLK
jgi:glycosyltransferase involved in cell wall biosynthesis